MNVSVHEMSKTIPIAKCLLIEWIDFIVMALHKVRNRSEATAFYGSSLWQMPFSRFAPIPVSC